MTPSLTSDPNITSNTIRAILTLLVVLIALISGPLLARHSSRFPVVVEVVRERNGKAPRREVAEPGNGGKWIGRITLLSVWLAAVISIVFIWLVGQDNKGVDITAWLANASDLGVRFGISLLVLAMSLVVARILQRSTTGSLHRARLNVNLIRLGGRIVYGLAIIIGAVVILDIWGTGLILPVTLVGALTVALSLALQDILRNLVSGVYLLVERPFVIGDQISVSPYTGEVEDIQMRVTVLRTLDDQRVLVPNALLFTSPVINQSFYQHRRVGLTVTIPDSSAEKLDAAEAHILQALKDVPEIIQQDPEPVVILNAVTGDKVLLRIAFWLSMMPPARQAGVISDAIERIRAALPEAEITMQDAATV
ncbi:MAG TPA: mechanosensitive ion channel family protein [Ktedonobacterales bacterium]|nr:mechanosensitive ion channel family protein [Ktedonobacterales bacterium]